MIGSFFQASRSSQKRFLLCILALLTGLPGGAFYPAPSLGQSPQPPSIRTQTPAPPQTQNPSPPSDAPADRESDAGLIRALFDGLRSDQFSEREWSSERLHELGISALPVLRELRRDSTDAEQSDRLNRIISSLAEQDHEFRIRSFLDGNSSELPNWSEMESWFGDSPRIREMFVDLYRAHPALVESLDGTPQQIALGLSGVRRRLLERSVGARETPQRIDLIALLLPMTKPNFTAGAQYDSIVISLLQLYPANEFQNDTVFGEPFMRMVSSWMLRSDFALREPVLRVALQWNMDIALPMAIESLKLNPDPILLCRCMQSIARQGTPAHAVLLVDHLDDINVVFQKHYMGTIGSDVQVGDVAAAAIACLHAVPVVRIGFSEPAEHPVFGIIYEELVVPMKPLADGQQDEAEKIDAEKIDDSDERPELPEGLDLRPELEELGFRPRTPRELAILRSQARRRQAARAEIHLNALELVAAAEPVAEPAAQPAAEPPAVERPAQKS